MSELRVPALSLEEQAALIKYAGLFDTNTYQRENPDIVSAGVSLLVHFCQQGWRELRDPSPNFNLWWYWVKHLGGDVAAPNPALHYAVVGQAQGLSTDASHGGFVTSAEKASFNLASMALLQALVADAATYARIAHSLGRLGAWDLAEIAADKAVGAAPDDAEHLYLLGEVLMKRQNWWRACEILANAVRADSSNANWFARLGEARVNMCRFVDAVHAYREALCLAPASGQLHYCLGYALAKAGDMDAASEAFQRAVALDTREDVQRLGLGMLHQDNGNWLDAVTEFAELAGQSGDGEAHYRHGLALEHCYRWSEALAAYRRALQLQIRPDWYYRVGQVLERLEEYGLAAQSYAQALDVSTELVADWCYRQGYALYCDGDYQGACNAWQQMYEHTVDLSTLPPEYSAVVKCELAEQGGDADRYFRLGVCCEHEQNWLGAAKAYEAAVSRQGDHQPRWYYRLGLMWNKAGKLRQACEAFAEVSLFKRPSLVEADARDTNQEFAEFSATLPLRRQVVLYESYAGRAMSCNPYAMFRYLLRQPGYGDWLHVWAVRQLDSVPLAYRRQSNVIVVEYESSQYRRYLATAEYLINNLCFPTYFIRREGQRYLNTWHGTPLKSLGRGVPGSFLAYKNTARNFLQATHLISPNAHTSRMLFDSYDVSGLLSAQLAETGYPRIDAVRSEPELCKALLNRLSITDERPVVLYAPTWRGTVDKFDDAVASVVETLTHLLSDDYQLVFRGHYFVEQAILRQTLPVTVATADIDSCELLSLVDVLITDYSSIFFDFLPTGRPILYYAYDLAEYQQVQGPLCFDLAEMPGHLCRDLHSLQQALVEVLQPASAAAFDACYRAALARFCPHEDGQSSARAVAFFFEGEQQYCLARKQVEPLLFHAGTFSPNGITASALNLMAALEARGDVLAVTVDPWRLESFPVRRERLERLPQTVHILARAGFMVLTAEEQWLVERFHSRYEVDDASIWPVLERAYRREFRRLFGDTRFAAVIDFSGYNRYWTSLFALGGADGVRKLIYLHADMVEEQRLRYPALLTQFRLYPRFDALVSVSTACSEAHRSALADAFAIAPQRFRVCGNMIDARAIQVRANESLDSDLQSWFGGTTFLALGRLSREKDQGKLIRAFAKIRREFPSVRLVIAGNGPLKGELAALITELCMQDAVLLAGQRSNPFALLARCACCVLSSNYEGQPMVLLEAMVLQRPIIATAIEANRAMLAGHYGSLAENSETGLVQAMREFLCSGQVIRHFDTDAYRQKALVDFDRLLNRKPTNA